MQTRMLDPLAELGGGGGQQCSAYCCDVKRVGLEVTMKRSDCEMIDRLRETNDSALEMELHSTSRIDQTGVSLSLMVRPSPPASATQGFTVTKSRIRSRRPPHLDHDLIHGDTSWDAHCVEFLDRRADDRQDDLFSTVEWGRRSAVSLLRLEAQ